MHQVRRASREPGGVCEGVLTIWLLGRASRGLARRYPGLRDSTLMKRLCVDASVVLRWEFPGPNESGALLVRSARIAGRVQLLVPDLLFAECAQAE